MSLYIIYLYFDISSVYGFGTVTQLRKLKKQIYRSWLFTIYHLQLRTKGLTMSIFQMRFFERLRMN